MKLVCSNLPALHPSGRELTYPQSALLSFLFCFPSLVRDRSTTTIQLAMTVKYLFL